MKICYFGIYNPDESRNKIYMEGLRQNGVEILECRDNSRGPLKYLKLFWKHWKIRNGYDFLIVGYPGHVVVPFAKLISNKRVALDALCSLYEGVIISRGKNGLFFLREKYTRLIDRLAIKFADIILVETKSQKRFFEEKLRASPDKVFCVYTGASDRNFYPGNIPKLPKFTAVFRGKFLPEAGVTHIIKAAQILEDKNIDFLIIGNGFLEAKVKSQIKDLKLKNLELISKFILPEELRERMLEAHVSLGQFEDHKRLSRTIPHKCFESLALGLPYITARAEPVAEILVEGENCLFVEAGKSEDLAEKILLLKENQQLGYNLGRNNRILYEKKFTPKILAAEILSIYENF